jgi:RNA polymerase sigma-70 factor (ECF subfamily)
LPGLKFAQSFSIERGLAGCGRPRLFTGFRRWFFRRRLEAARNGSSEALGQLLETYRWYFWLAARQQLAPDLQSKVGPADLVQDTFLEAQRDLAQFSGQTEEEWLAWLRRLRHNNVLNVARRFRETEMRAVGREVSADTPKMGPVLEESLIDPEPGPEELVLAQEEAALLKSALEQLPEHYQRVLLLYYRERQSFEVIGQTLGRSADAVRKLWARAVEHLHRLMEPPQQHEENG